MGQVFVRRVHFLQEALPGAHFVQQCVQVLFPNSLPFRPRLIPQLRVDTALQKPLPQLILRSVRVGTVPLPVAVVVVVVVVVVAVFIPPPRMNTME
jgi:hypothetical protein